MDENTKTVILTALAFAAPIASAAIYYFFHVRGALLPGAPQPSPIIPPNPPAQLAYVDLTLEDASTKVPLPSAPPTFKI